MMLHNKVKQIYVLQIVVLFLFLKDLPLFLAVVGLCCCMQAVL